MNELGNILDREGRIARASSARALDESFSFSLIPRSEIDPMEKQRHWSVA
jgi:hypothetical protein